MDIFCLLLLRLGDRTSIDYVHEVDTVASVVLVVGWLVGVAWSVRVYFPFFTSRSNYFRGLVAGGLAIPIVALGWLVLVALMWAKELFFFMAPPFTEFRSSAVPAKQIIIVNESWLDTELLVFVKGQDGRLKFVWDLGDEFAEAKWTKDGTVFVCMLTLPKTSGRPGVMVAYDFNTGQAHGPGSKDLGYASAATWQAVEPTVDALVSAHGGFETDWIGFDTIRSGEQWLWFWQVPDV